MRYVVLVAALLCVLPASAQGLRVGVEAGAGAVSLLYEKPQPFWRTALRPSYSAAVLAAVPLHGRLSLQSGLRYARLGNSVDYAFDAEQTGLDEEGNPVVVGTVHVEGRFQISQHYVTLPLRARYQVVDGSVYVFAGPELGYLTSAQSRIDRSLPAELAMDESRDVTGDVRRVNVVAAVGVGSRIPVGRDAFYVQLLYGRGVVDAAKPEQWGTNWKTQEVSLSVGYAF